MSAPARQPLTFAGAVWVSVGSIIVMMVLIAGGIAAGVLVSGPLGITLAIILLALGPLTALLVPNLVLRRR